MKQLDIVKKMYRYNYISFDVFNTLLIRKSKRCEEIFEKVEEKLKLEGYNIPYKKKRMQAASVAQSKGKAEATFADIYNALDIDENIKTKALEIELEEEKSDLIPNLYLRNFIRFAKRNGKIIIVISDMYLDSSFIGALLKENGFVYDELFVSSDYQARKSRGALYNVVLNKLNIKPKDIIHIGDNFQADYLMALKNGIKTLIWKKGEQLNPHTSAYLKCNEKGKKLFEFLSLYSCSLDEDYKIGYELFGPLLLGMSKWIHRVYMDEGLDHLYFLARDGYIIRKAYQILYPSEHTYLHISRRAVTVPHLRLARSMKDVIKLIPYIKRIEKTKDFLYKIGIEEKGIVTTITHKYGYEVSRELLLGNLGEELYSDIEMEMKNNAEKEETAYKAFLRKNIRGSKIAIVDIGWYGTIQTELGKVLNEKNCRLLGLYFGFLKKENDHLNAVGYAYDYRDCLKTKYDSSCIFGFNGLIELMFTANHGSVKKYKIDSNGQPCYELEEEFDESNKFIRDAQAGAIDFIKDVKKVKADFGVESELLYAGLNDLLENPSIHDCKRLGNMLFFDAYYEKLIQYPGLIRAMKNPRKLLVAFLKSNWKIGFLKEMLPIVNGALLFRFINRLRKSKI